MTTSRGRRAWARATGTALVVALTGAGCTSGGGSGDSAAAGAEVPEGDPVDGGSMVVAINAEVTGWNPTFDRWGPPSALAGSAMLEPLTTLDAEARPQPWLATEWTSNEDFTQWTVTLRDDVTFHNGERFNAQSVKQNIEAAVAGVTSGVALTGLFGEIVVIDDTTLEVNLNTPWAAFPSSYMAGQNAFQRAPETLAMGAEAGKNPIGTGPFMFDEWEPDVALKMEKNPDYWREGEPHLAALEFRVIVDETTRSTALKAGDVDMIFTASGTEAEGIEGDEDFTVVKDWDTEPTMLIANTINALGGAPNPMANVHARTAIAMATDAETVAALVGDGIAVPASPFAEGNPWHDAASEEAYPGFDPEGVAAEIDAHERDTGEDGLSVTVVGTTENTSRTVLQALEEQWESAGIDAEIEIVESTAWVSRGISSNFELLLGPIYNSPDPDQNHLFWSASTVRPDGEVSINFSGFTNDVTEAALADGRATDDVDARRAAYNELVTQINESAVNIWLYWTPYSLIASSRVHGLDGAEELPFGNFQPKPWWGQVWISS